MKLTFLGTGGAFTDFRINYHNNALVHTSVGLVMIDCGATAVQSCREMGLEPWDLRALLITHLHGDHIGGIEQMGWERYFTGPNYEPGKLSTCLAGAADVLAPLEDYLAATMDSYVDLDEGPVTRRPYEKLFTIEQSSQGGTEWCFGDVRMRLEPTEHVLGADGGKPAYGVWLETENNRAYYSSDTRFDEEKLLGERMKASVIFHDCAFYPYSPSSPHTHYEQLLSLPAAARAKIVLMHHTSVPPELDPLADGFKGVATRHSVWEF